MILKKRTQELNDYARRFLDTVRHDHEIAHFTDQNPEIICYREDAILSSDSTGYKFARKVSQKTAENEPLISAFYDGEEHIEIYRATLRTIEELYEAVRHECLHFILEKSGYDSEDTSDFFLLLAIAYDACPYGLLDESQAFFFERMDKLKKELQQKAENRKLKFR